ncbi:MAG TPA: PfkB family carbohydrate kinase [Candidatus Methylomirabilis sp.]|nr:PfkB family carbohydrate kinase [Candidatus Methylomirabilis sp.]
MSPADLAARPFDVVGFGVNALDLIAIIDGYPQPDTKVQFREFDVQGGGVVATAMVACARLGLRSRYVGKVGSDFWSRVSLRTLSKEGIDVRHVLKAKGSPGHVSLVLADKNTGARTLFFRRPPAYAIRPDELDREALTAGRLLHVDGVDAAAAFQAVTWAREAGMRVTMDGERIVEGIENVWPRVDLLVCNPRFVRGTTGHAAVEDGLREMADRGPSRVAVTLAEKGVLGYEGGRPIRVKGLRVEPVDTNGAGDVFHGACAVGELRGWPFEWVLAFANAVAAMKCRHLGGRRGIPSLPEVVEFLTAHGRRDIADALI